MGTPVDVYECKGSNVVVEYLTFCVPAERRAAWLEVEERTWSRFLEAQDGFVRKEMWADRGDVDLIHAIIWWESESQWRAIARDELAAVDAAMGDHCVAGELRVFDVVRDC